MNFPRFLGVLICLLIGVFSIWLEKTDAIDTKKWWFFTLEPKEKPSDAVANDGFSS